MFRALEVFRERLNDFARQKIESKCFLVGLFIVPSAEFVFFASDSLNYPFYPQRKPVVKHFKTKKKSLYYLPSPISLTLPSPPTPSPPPPPLGPGLGSNCIVCAVLFLLLVVVRHFPHFLCLSLFLPVWKYPNALCNSICNMKAIQRAKMERSVGGWVCLCV